MNHIEDQVEREVMEHIKSNNLLGDILLFTEEQGGILGGIDIPENLKKCLINVIW